MDTCHYTSAQTHGMYNTEGEPQKNYGLWVIMMCQCQLISCHKRSNLVGDVDKSVG